MSTENQCVSGGVREATRGSAIKLGAELLVKLIALFTSLFVARRLAPGLFTPAATMPGRP